MIQNDVLYNPQTQNAMQQVDTGNSNLFTDPCFHILHYWDAEESLYVAIKGKDDAGNSLFPGLTLVQIIENRIKPALSEILCKEVNGYFDTTYSFSMDEKYVLINSVNQVAVRNL